MKTKKRYIAPSVDVVTVLQENPLLLGSPDIDDNTGGGLGKGDIEMGDYAKEYDSYSFWDEYDTDENKSLWD